MHKFLVNNEYKWYSLGRVVEEIKTIGPMDWLNNMKLKYITLRIDTRTMSCLIKDKDGNYIEIEEITNLRERDNE